MYTHLVKLKEIINRINGIPQHNDETGGVSMPSRITPGHIKQNNRQQIYSYIYHQRKVSQQDLVYALRLSRPTVAANLAELEEDGVSSVMWTALTTPRMSFFIPLCADIERLPAYCAEPDPGKESLFWTFKEMCLLTQRRYARHMGITGAAWATLTGYVAGFAAVFILCAAKKMRPQILFATSLPYLAEFIQCRRFLVNIKK